MRPLASTVPKFADFAGVLAQRAAEMLGASVLVTDARGSIIAGSTVDLLRLSQEQLVDAGFMHLPLHVDGQAGEVLVGQPPEGEIIPARLAQAVLELLINQTTVVERLPNPHELKSNFIYDLLHGHMPDEESIFRHARFLGLDLNPPRAVILIDAADYILGGNEGRRGETDEVRAQKQAQMVIKSVVSFFHLPNDTICAYIGDGEVAVLKASNTKNLGMWAADEALPADMSASWANLAALKRAGDALLGRLRRDTGASVNVGIGRYHPGVNGLALSYQDAKAALLLGRRFHGHNQVHCLDGLGIPAFVGLSDEQTKLELAQHLLSPLDHEPEMIDTLNAFFAENGAPSSTAKRLSIHRNTLSYRLDKITSLTGLDPRRFDDAVQIRLALVLRSLHPEVVPDDS